MLALRLIGILEPRLQAERVTGAYRIQHDVLPAVARMERRGVGFDGRAHAALLDDLKERRLELEQQFEAACIKAGRPELALDGVPSTPAGKGKLLAALLTPEELEAWPVTPRGLAKSTKRADLRRGAHHAPIAVLAEFGIVGKQLTSFGSTLAAFVHNGRIHASYNVAQANTGRASCSGPNVQQTPKEKRQAVPLPLRRRPRPRLRRWRLVGDGIARGGLHLRRGHHDRGVRQWVTTCTG